MRGIVLPQKKKKREKAIFVDSVWWDFDEICIFDIKFISFDYFCAQMCCFCLQSLHICMYLVSVIIEAYRHTQI